MSPKPPSPKKKAATLARVRDNQRRCSRTETGICVELEKIKIQDLQNTIRENAKDHHTSVERLEAENRQLRELVANTGTGFNRSRTPQSRDSRNWGDNSNAIARATLREEASAPGDSEALPDEMNFASTADAFTGSSSIDFSASFFNIPEREFQLFNLSRTIPIVRDTPTVRDLGGGSNDFQSIPILSDCGPMCSKFAGSALPRDCGPTNISTVDSGTTLCSEAYELLRRHNNRGVDMIEIGIRLWNGFRKVMGIKAAKLKISYCSVF